MPRNLLESFAGAFSRTGRGRLRERVLFGSDQMVWPQAIEAAIDGIESAPFLTKKQKRDILYNNAARFLRRTTPVVP